MRKYFVIKSFNTETLKWSYLKRAGRAGEESAFSEDIRWAWFYRSEIEAGKILEALPKEENNYYTIEEVYHKF